MRAYVIDSSVAVKWFTEETGTEAALKLREAASTGKCRLEAPDLLLYELANALRFHPRLSAADVKLAIGSLLDLGIIFHAAESPLLERAVELAFRYRTTVYDSCFIALADHRGLPLVTADEKLIERAGRRAGIVRLGDAVG
jgi:predicted nucleic acid-binding protein